MKFTMVRLASNFDNYTLATCSLSNQVFTNWKTIKNINSLFNKTKFLNMEVLGYFRIFFVCLFWGYQLISAQDLSWLCAQGLPGGPKSVKMPGIKTVVRYMQSKSLTCHTLSFSLFNSCRNLHIAKNLTVLLKHI